MWLKEEEGIAEDLITKKNSPTSEIIINNQPVAHLMPQKFVIHYIKF